MIYDISLPLDKSVAVWQGDTPFRFGFVSQQNAGSSVTVGAVSMSTHTGSHLDAPFHFAPAGVTIDALGLELFIGRARVVDCTGRQEISPELFAGLDLTDTPRVLLKTNCWEDYSRFPDSVPNIEPETVALFAARNVVLLGVDFPSVDVLDSRELPVHHYLHTSGIAILESVNLRDVPPGVYELIALPLRLIGADASPVRAVLRTFLAD